jgi:hypothetical protein
MTQTRLLEALVSGAPDQRNYHRFASRNSMLWPYVNERPGEDPLYQAMVRAKRSTRRATQLALTNRNGYPVYVFGEDRDTGTIPFIAAAAQLHLNRPAMYQLARGGFIQEPWEYKRGWVTTLHTIERWYAFHAHLDTPTGRYEWVLSHDRPKPAPWSLDDVNFVPNGYAIPRTLAALQLGITPRALDTLARRGGLTRASDRVSEAVYITYASLFSEHEKRSAPRSHSPRAGRPTTVPPPWSFTTDAESEDPAW